MGLVTVLLDGDFSQTLPILPRETRTDEFKTCSIKSTQIRPNFKFLFLRVNMRGSSWLMGRRVFRLIDDGKFMEEEGRVYIPVNLCDILGDLISLTDTIVSQHSLG